METDDDHDGGVGGDDLDINDSLSASLLSNSSSVDEPPPPPERVILYTCLPLLALLSVVKHANIDGTFKVMSRQFRQLFIMICDYHGGAIPIAFGFLPSKESISYGIFMLMLLLAFKKFSAQVAEITGKSTIKLRKLKCDFESSIHVALSSLFKLSGCYFHWSQVCNFIL